MSRISPIVLLAIVILAIGFFLLGLLQLAIRCVMNNLSFSSTPQSNRLSNAPTQVPHTFQRQLLELFRLHDSGLEQSLIDALPVFNYKDIMGSKEPFDCAVCLSEFSSLEKLKFLPNCTHAFHIHCIDTWLLSNSTCPLCRTQIGLWNHVDKPLSSYDTGSSPAHPTSLQDRAAPARILSVRLGKFRSSNEGVDSEAKMEKEVTSSNIDERRCYSMGAFQYVVGEANLQVALPSGKGIDNAEAEEEKIGRRIRGDSFSVSKIWLWSKKGKFLISSSEANENIVASMSNTSNLA